MQRLLYEVLQTITKDIVRSVKELAIDMETKLTRKKYRKIKRTYQVQK